MAVGNEDCWGESLIGSSSSATSPTYYDTHTVRMTLSSVEVVCEVMVLSIPISEFAGYNIFKMLFDHVLKVDDVIDVMDVTYRGVLRFVRSADQSFSPYTSTSSMRCYYADLAEEAPYQTVERRIMVRSNGSVNLHPILPDIHRYLKNRGISLEPEHYHESEALTPCQTGK